MQLDVAALKRRRRKLNQRRQRNTEFDRLRVFEGRGRTELLEDRILLAADLTFDATGTRTLIYNSSTLAYELDGGSTTPPPTVLAANLTSDLVIAGTTGADTLILGSSLPANVSIKFHGGNGADTLEVPANFDMFATGTADVVFDGGNQGDTLKVTADADMMLTESQLVVDDPSSAAQRIFVLDQAIDLSDGSLTLSTGIENVELNGGASANAINVLANATSEVTVDGMGAGDQITIDAAGNSYTTSIGGGLITFDVSSLEDVNSSLPPFQLPPTRY